MGRPRSWTIVWAGLVLGSLAISIGAYLFGLDSNVQVLPHVPPVLVQPTFSPPRPPPLWETPAATDSSASPTESPRTFGPGVLVVTSEAAQSVTLVDAASYNIVKTIPLGVPLRDVAIGPDGRTAWVFGDQPNQTDFYLVDVASGKLRDTKRLRDLPTAVGFSNDGSRAFVALQRGNGISFLNGVTRDEFGTVELGRQTVGVQMHRGVRGVAAAPGARGEVLFVAGEGSGVVWALDAGSGRLLSEIEVGGGPTFLLRSPGGHKVYAVADGLNQIVAIDTMALAVSSRIPLPGRPTGAAINSRGVIAVSGGNEGELWIVDSSRWTPPTRIIVGSRPAGVTFSPDGRHAYVANQGDGTISVVDMATMGNVLTFRAGKNPTGLAFATLPTSPAALSAITLGQSSSSAAVGVGPASSQAKPTGTPTLVPTPTPLPPGATPTPDLPPDALKETFVPHAEFPVSLAFAPDGRLFYAECHTGNIRIVQNGQLLPTPFYRFVVSGEPETGLLGLALDPNFVQNHFVYAFYTSVAGGGTQSGGINGPNEVVRLTEVNNRGTNLTPILRDLPSGPIHNAGGLRFGPDGKLYVSLGDTDNGNKSQDLSSPVGKILRINSDGSIPSDNPFFGQRGKNAAVWAYGLRNTFRFDFQPITHSLVGADNGPGDNDEINLIAKGGNYGWPPAGYQGISGSIDPLAVMNPPISPTGFTFYTGEQFTTWTNDLFYCDYHQRQLRRVHLVAESFDRIVDEEVVTPGCTLDVTTGPDGALYFSDLTGIDRIRRKGAPTLPAVSLAGAATTVPTTPLPAGTQIEDRDVNVTLTEGRLTPSRTRIPVGNVRFLAENVGSTPHALEIVGEGLDVRTADIAPGESATLTLNLAPGAYQLVYPVPGPIQPDMTATISIVGA